MATRSEATLSGATPQSDAHSVANCSVAVSSVFVENPHPIPGIPANTLREEDYADAVAALIERDFFPDLPALRLRQALLQARHAGDQKTAEELLWRILRDRPTPTSKGGSAPGCGASSRHGGNERDQSDAASASDWDRGDAASSVGPRSEDGQQLRLASGSVVVVDLSSARLDDFQHEFTSEDTASFHAILKKDQENQRAKEWWVEGEEQRHNKKQKVLIRTLELGGCVPHGEMISNLHKGRNPVFLKPLTIPQRVLERPKCVFKNTRFTTDQQTKLDQQMEAAMTKARGEGEANASYSTDKEIRHSTGKQASHLNSSSASSSLDLLEDDIESEMHFQILEISDRERAAENLRIGQRLHVHKQHTRMERLRTANLASSPVSQTPGNLRTPSGIARTAAKVSPLSPIGQLVHRAQRLSQKGGRLRITNSKIREVLPKKRKLG